MLYYKLYPSKEAAMLAAEKWTHNTRADWEILPLKDWTHVTPAQVQPCDRPRLTGARLDGITIRAHGPFARYGERDAGTASMLFAAVWEAPQ